ncbi:MAG: hypothetical protein ACLTL9_02400 [Akkermansia muciniphila]
MLIEFTLLTGTKSNGQIFSIKPGGCRGYLPMQRKNYLCPILTPMPGSITAAAEVLYNIPHKHRRMNLLHKKAPFIFHERG